MVKKLVMFSLFAISMLISGFGAGYVFGYRNGHAGKCPKDLTAALKGCELVAAQINNELSECEYKWAQTEAALENCRADMRGIFKQLLPDSKGKSMRKQ